MRSTGAGESGRCASIAGVVAAAGMAILAVVHTMAASQAAGQEDEPAAGDPPPDDSLPPATEVAATEMWAAAPGIWASGPQIWVSAPQMEAVAPEVAVSAPEGGASASADAGAAVEHAATPSSAAPGQQRVSVDAGAIPAGWALPPARAQSTHSGGRLASDAQVEAALVPGNPARDRRDGRSLDMDAPIEAALAGEPPVVEPIVEAAQRKLLEPELLLALAWHESRFDPDAVSHAGAVGVMQVMPGTLEWMADELDRALDPRDPADNALAGAAYLDRLLSAHEDPAEALIAYNQGPTALAENGPYPGAEAFADKVLSTRDQLREVRLAGFPDD